VREKRELERYNRLRMEESMLMMEVTVENTNNMEERREREKRGEGSEFSLPTPHHHTSLPSLLGLREEEGMTPTHTRSPSQIAVTPDPNEMVVRKEQEGGGREGGEGGEEEEGGGREELGEGHEIENQEIDEAENDYQQGREEGEEEGGEMTLAFEKLQKMLSHSRQHGLFFFFFFFCCCCCFLTLLSFLLFLMQEEHPLPLKNPPSVFVRVRERRGRRDRRVRKKVKGRRKERRRTVKGVGR